MSETETKAEGRKPIVFDSSTVSLGLALGGIFALGLFTTGFACAPFAIIGLAFGVVGFYQRKRRGKKLLSDVSAISAVVVNSFLIFVAVFSVYDQGDTRNIAQRLVCGTHLSRLGKAMLIAACYCDDKYPTPDKWCDLLVKYAQVTEEEFVCPSVGEGRCHYAMNPNAKLTSPPNMVVLFETKGGWNQSGGPEILTFENHKGKGCNVLFNDCSVEFVTLEQLRELKWKDEQLITGTVRYVQVEGGFYGIVGDNGKKYDPVNLPPEYAKDGLRVKFQVKEMKGMVGIHMWGEIVEVLKISKLEYQNKNNK